MDVSVKEMSGVTGDDWTSQLTEQMKAKISEAVGKALENSLSHYIDRLQTTIVPVVDDMMAELKDSILQEIEERRVLDMNPSSVKKSKSNKAPKKGVTKSVLYQCKFCGKIHKGTCGKPRHKKPKRPERLGTKDVTDTMSDAQKSRTRSFYITATEAKAEPDVISGSMQREISSFFQRQPSNVESSSSSSKPLKIDMDNLPWDPSERKPISSYHPSQKDEIRRAYLLRGPCQPQGKKDDFPQTQVGNGDRLRRFNPKCGQNDAFVSEGVRCWHKKEEKLNEHVGKGNNTFHERAVEKGEDLLKEAQSVLVCNKKKSEKERKEYRTRLSASVMIAQGLLNGGLPFRGHDEPEESLYRGHFIEFLKLFGQINEEISKVILSNASRKNQMTAPSIQKDICNCFAEEVLKKIFEELGDDVFSILVDESRDISKKEQMAVVLRYVDKLGFVKERFIGLVHVKETTALSLKHAIDELFARYNLSLGRVRGQGYDGASNMSGEFNDLTNVVGASCKRIDLLRESQRERLQEPGNQEMSIARAGDIRWSSHEKTLLRLLTLYPCVLDVLEYIETSAWDKIHKAQAYGLQLYVKSYKFVFYLHLMKHILGVTNLLCVALQRKNQDIINAVELVRSTKEELQRYRLEGFDSLLKDVTCFCDKYDIEMINMEDEYVDPKYRRKKTNITNRHHFEVNNFNTVLDMQIQELGNRFNELAEMYPRDFTFDEKDDLTDELGHYIRNVKKDSRFNNLNGISDLAKKMVETRKHIDYQLVYRLMKLSLVLPVATTSVERSFSSVKHVKTELRNRMGDGYMNDACICYVEREFLQQVSVENVMQRFQKMKPRREQL
ncbi:zinc finger MYM-type protein 1-like [Helianthus annuus]|uniref:zinc finger MYM-type protein 1-like n=1 Tax=Helianthus annuus TaxID=4232 RepID=UPI000B8F2961|nr:zinc finger MYM-type protein 1-like [Helianthus annuus]